VHGERSKRVITSVIAPALPYYRPSMDILLVMSDFERLSGAQGACVEFREPSDFSRIMDQHG